MTEAEVLAAIAQGESAYGLLVDADPTAARRFKRLCRQMTDYLASVQQHFPDAQYYTGSGGFNLMLGSSHDARGMASQQELVALGGVGVSIGDGDF